MTSLIVFLELRQETGVYSQVKTLGWPFKTRVWSATSGLLSGCEGHLRILREAWQGNRDTSRGEVGDPGSFFSCHRDIGVPLNFQEESGIISF